MLDERRGVDDSYSLGYSFWYNRTSHQLWPRCTCLLQATYLDNWESLEEEHSNALSGCMEALESAILRVPVTGGARVWNFSHTFRHSLLLNVHLRQPMSCSSRFLLPWFTNVGLTTLSMFLLLDTLPWGPRTVDRLCRSRPWLHAFFSVWFNGSNYLYPLAYKVLNEGFTWIDDPVIVLAGGCASCERSSHLSSRCTKCGWGVCAIPLTEGEVIALRFESLLFGPCLVSLNDSGAKRECLQHLPYEYVESKIAILNLSGWIVRVAGSWRIYFSMQTQSMEALLSQLAETAAQERALLEECGDLLSVAASLEVKSFDFKPFPSSTMRSSGVIMLVFLNEFSWKGVCV